ncbi:Hypothetical protein, putative, partial [Bodo saltans]
KLSVFGDNPLERAEADARQHAHTQAQLDKLWSTRREREAWIEIVPPSLPSADVVLHIPGVITLAFRCRDAQSEACDAPNIAEALMSMGGGTSKKQRNVYATKLQALGAPVVPILYSARSGMVLPGGMDEGMLCAMGEKSIVAEGVCEPTLRFPWAPREGDKERFPPYIDAHAQRNDIRLHRIRRNMMLFDYRQDECADAEDLASVRVSTKACAAVGGGQSCVSSQILDERLAEDRSDLQGSREAIVF